MSVLFPTSGDGSAVCTFREQNPNLQTTVYLLLTTVVPVGALLLLQILLHEHGP